MKYRIIFSVTSKSAMTPSFSGRTALMWPGVRPIIRFASLPTARMWPVFWLMRHDRRLVEDDTAAAHVDERVRGAEVDGHVTAEVLEGAFEHDVGLPTQRGTHCGPGPWTWSKGA